MAMKLDPRNGSQVNWLRRWYNTSFHTSLNASRLSLRAFLEHGTYELTKTLDTTDPLSNLISGFHY